MNTKIIAALVVGIALVTSVGMVSADVDARIDVRNDGTSDYMKIIDTECGRLVKMIENDGGMSLSEIAFVDGGILDFEEFTGVGDTDYEKYIETGAVDFYKRIENTGMVDIMEFVDIECGDLIEDESVWAIGETAIHKEITLWGINCDPWFGEATPNNRAPYDEGRHDSEAGWQGEGAYMTAAIMQSIGCDDGMLMVDETLDVPDISENKWQLFMTTDYLTDATVDIDTDVDVWTVYPTELTYPSGNVPGANTDLDYFHYIYPSGGIEDIAINPNN